MKKYFLRSKWSKASASKTFVSIRLFPLFFILFFSLSASAQRTFVHPGLMHKRSDLDRMKYMVQAGKDPWKTSFQNFSLNGYASYNYVVQGNSSITALVENSSTAGYNYELFKYDALAAYYNSLMWYITGDVRHAQKSVQIFNAWSNLTRIVSNGTKALDAGRVIWKMLEGAEIIKSTYSGWPATDINKFKAMLVYPGYSSTVEPTAAISSQNTGFYWYMYNGDYGRHGNQGLFAMRGVMAMGVFMDNELMYDRALRYLRGQPHRSDDLPYVSGPTITSANPNANTTSYFNEYSLVSPYIQNTIPDYGYNEVISNYIWENGQCQESSRDQDHAINGTSIISVMSEMAWNQGDNLYGHLANRPLLGLEFYFRYNVSFRYPFADQPTPWEPTVASGEFIRRKDRSGRWESLKINPYYEKDSATISRGAGFKSSVTPIHEMILGHYRDRIGVAATDYKWTKRAQDISISESGYEGQGFQVDYPGWGGLTFHRKDLCPGDPVYYAAGNPVYRTPLVTDVVEAENFDHFTIDGQNKVYYDNTTINTGGQYRTGEAVDIENCTEGGYNLTSLENGEWVNYTVEVPASGHYKLDIRYAALAAGGTVKFEFDGVDKTGFVAIPYGDTNSNGSQDWQALTVSNDISLKPGVQSMRVFISGTSNTVQLNNFTVSYVAALTPQTITFPAIPAKTTSSADFSPGATASSGLPVSYSSSNTSVATIVNNQVHIVGGGTTQIIASQEGNNVYDAAPDVSQTLTATGIAAGDYVSSGAMAWNGGTWSISDGAGGYSGTTTTAPGTTSNVHILAGHTVTLGTTAASIKNLTVQEGATLLQQAALTVSQLTAINGTLTVGGPSATNTYVLTVNNVSIPATGVLASTTQPIGSVSTLLVNTAGTIAINGRIGAPVGSAVNTAGSGIRIFVNGAGTTTFTGTGSCNVARLSPNSGNTSNQTIIIDVDMELRNYAGTGVASLSLQNGSVGSGAKVLIINAGKTVKLNGDNSLGAFHGVYSNAYGNSVANNSGSSMIYNINGTLDCSTAQFNLVTNQQTAANAITVNVTGTLKLGPTVRLFRYLAAQSINVNVGDDAVVDGSTAAANLNLLTNGGSINTANHTGTVAAANATTMGGVTFSGNNPVVGTYAFDGSGGSGYITSPSVLFTGGTLSNSLAPTNAIATITNGAVTAITVLSTGTYTVKPTGILFAGGSGPTQWFSINGADRKGVIKSLVAANVEMPFWIGTSNASYTPVNIRPTSSSIFTVNLLEGNVPSGLASSTYAINRTWNITPATPSATDLTFGYNDGDGNSSFNPSASQTLMHYNNTTIAWEAVGTNATPVAGVGTNRKVNYTGITDFSPFTLINANIILPVSLLSFSATAQPNLVDIAWSTTSEKGVKEYQVLRSADGRSFETIGSKNAVGIASMTIKYSLTDFSPLNGISYYQLKSVDKDGKVQYSKVVAVQFGQAVESVTVVNPVESGTVTIVVKSASKPTFQLTDYLGRTIPFTIVSQNGNTYRIQISDLALKSAILTLITDKGKQSKKLVFN